MDTNLPKSISRIINELNSHKKIENALVAEIVSEANLNENDLAEFNSFNHSTSESYGRKLIYDNGNFKILLMSWNSGDYTAIHNHGYTEWGCVYFFGDATHRLYSVANDELSLVKKDNFTDGQIVSVCGELTHIMGNSSPRGFTTLHIYGSNTFKRDFSKDTIVYLPEIDKQFTTMGSAYLNMDKQLILSEKPLIKTSYDMIVDYFSLIKPFYERIGKISVLKKVEKEINNWTVN
ncbi:MAG: cysteine dioxygenase family protein [Bacteroidales bacterium]|nr:cysteine dioxygenase family protein [Bacteroidales bacterium]